MLIAINAKDEATTFRALKSELQEEIPYFSFRFNDLKSILKNLKEKHNEIADDFCTGKGLQLMNLDGKITEYIIDKFTQNNVPVLCIHDSFVVPRSKDDFLRRTMNEAIINVTSQGLPKIDRKGLGLNDAGWRTTTTKSRINALLACFTDDCVVYQRAGQWLISTTWSVANPWLGKDWVSYGWQDNHNCRRAEATCQPVLGNLYDLEHARAVAAN